MSESLNCDFYRYTGDPRVANKNLGSAVYQCSSIKPVEPLSDLDIRLIIGYPDNENGTPAVMSANYVAIDNKYYQITNKERLPANSLAIYGTIDGLMSYFGEVSACDCVCARNSEQYNSQFVDEKYMLIQNREIETYSAGSIIPYGDYCIVMCCNTSLPKKNEGGTSEQYKMHEFSGNGAHW